MASLLLVAHAPLASALLAVARHVYPDCSNALAAVDVQPGADLESVQASIRNALRGLAAEEVLILADVFGATPCNAALAEADGHRIRVVAGANVPMLWRTLCYANASLEDLVARALAGASQGVMHVSVPRRQTQPTLPSSDDQSQHHDQQ
jgi:mannose PTS system EIIA component